jgi:AcrR family transcriptional regulator
VNRSGSRAPAGTLYHRFGNRNGILIATWLRALQRHAHDVELPPWLEDDLAETVRKLLV